MSSNLKLLDTIFYGFEQLTSTSVLKYNYKYFVIIKFL